jgi:hypothetical protein
MCTSREEVYAAIVAFIVYLIVASAFGYAKERDRMMKAETLESKCWREPQTGLLLPLSHSGLNLESRGCLKTWERFGSAKDRSTWGTRLIAAVGRYSNEKHLNDGTNTGPARTVLMFRLYREWNVDFGRILSNLINRDHNDDDSIHTKFTDFHRQWRFINLKYGDAILLEYVHRETLVHFAGPIETQEIEKLEFTWTTLIEKTTAFTIDEFKHLETSWINQLNKTT